MADHRFFNPFPARPPYDPNASIGSLMGERVPCNVRHVDVWEKKGKITWRTKSGGYHEMDWPADGDVMPVIIAMRISC